jgi:alpha 1,2-mannosyltransferase
MAISRRPRILAAIVISCLILYLVGSREAITDAWTAARLAHKNGQGLSSLLPPGFASDKPFDGSPQYLVGNAHKLPFADAFANHFEAVRQQPGMTMREARAGCTWPADEYVDFQFNPDTEWVVTERPDTEIMERRREWQDFVGGGNKGRMIPWDMVADRFHGRGLVILAGNQDTIMRVKVILRQLVRLGSKVAVEIHYWDDEMNDDERASLEALYPDKITFNDLSKGHNLIRIKKDGFYINYQLKPAAVLNSRFAEPLLLDSDNIPVIDPAQLWDSAVYAEYGTVFWPDIARTWPQNPAWALTNTACRMNEHEQESGQMLVDKRRYWYHLQLASWMSNEKGDYYTKFLLGDKDTFRFAWHALKTAYGKPARWLTSVGTINDGYYCGNSFAQHHPDGGEAPIAFLHGGLVKTVSLQVMRWNKELKGGYFRTYKRAPSELDPSVNVNVGIKFDGASYMPDHAEDFHWAQCTDMYDVEAKPFDEILPGWDKIYEEIGGYWQLEKEDKEKAKATTA